MGDQSEAAEQLEAAPQPAAAAAAAPAFAPAAGGAGLSALALQRAAGNAAVARAVASGALVAPGGTGNGSGAGGVLARKPKAKATAATPSPRQAVWFAPPKSRDPEELRDAMFAAYNSFETAEDLFHADVWAILVMTGGRMYMYDHTGKSYGAVRLKGKALLPADGFYMAAKPPTGDWETRKLLDLGNAGVTWVPWTYANKDVKGTVYFDDMVIDSDVKEFKATMGDVSHIALIVSDVAGTKAQADKARSQIARIRKAIAKLLGKGQGAAPGSGSSQEPQPLMDPPAQPPQGQTTTGGGGQKPPDIPDTVGVVETADGVNIRLTLDGAKQDIAYRDGETDEKLLQRIKDATQKLRDEIDVSKSVRVAGSTEEVKIDQKPGVGGVAVPDGFPITPGGMVPNAPGYPARIISHGPGSQQGHEDTVSGSSISFTMELDYAALSMGWRDETFNRLQPIAYKWELIDIGGLDLVAIKSRLKSAGNETDSGIARDLARDLGNTWEDTKADFVDVISQPGMQSYLAVVAISDLVQVGGALISSFFSVLTQPMNERSIAFGSNGTYLLRCFAQPVVDEDTVQRIIERGHRPVIRAPSAAVYPVRVSNINQRAKEVNDLELGAIETLRKQKADPPFPFTAEDIQERLDEAVAALGDNTVEALKRQEDNTDRELGRIRQWREADRAGTNVEQRDVKLRLWKAQLDLQGIELGAYEARLQEIKKQIPTLRTRYTGFGMRGIEGRAFRPRMTLVSEINGQVYSLVTNLGETARSREGRRVWRLIDVTSADTQDTYEGSGRTHTEAIQAAIDNFRDNSGYGRGSLAVRLPVDQIEAVTKEKVKLREEVMRVRPGVEARALKRLQDLATAAELAAMVVGGPIGLAIGVVGGVAGGIVAAENLRRRAAADRLKADFQTAMDILGVVGAVVAVGGVAAQAARRAAQVSGKAAELEGLGAQALKMQRIANRATKVGDALHIVGQGMMAGQVIIIPMALYHELEAIDKEEKADPSPSKGKYRAKRLEAYARAVKSGAVFVRQLQMASDPTAGWDPFRQKPGEGGTPQAPVEPRPSQIEGNGKPPPTEGPAVKPAPAESGAGTPPPLPPPPKEPAGGSGVPKQPAAPVGETIAAPKRAQDATQPAALRDLTVAALGRGIEPQSHRIKLVDPSVVQVLWDHAQGAGGAQGRQGAPTEAPKAFYDPDAGHVYVSRDAFLASPEMQRAAFEGVMKHMDWRGVKALGEPVARALGEKVFQATIEGAPPVEIQNPRATELQTRLAKLVGQEMINRLVYGGEVNAFSSKLAEVLGSARGNALEVALRKGQLDVAARLAGEPNPTMSNMFGEMMAVATADMLAKQMGGKPKGEWRAALAEQISALVGKDLVEGAYFRGEAEPLRAALQEKLGVAGYDQLVGAMQEGNVAGALKTLRNPPPKGAKASAPVEPKGKPAVDEPSKAPAEPQHPAPPPKPVEPLGGKAVALREAIGRGAPAEQVRQLALETIAEAPSFKELRRQAAEMGPDAVKALQAAREQLISDVNAEISKALKAKYPGVEVTFDNMGSPGFNSDMDFTINVKPGKGATVNDAIAASVEGVRAAYDVFNGTPEPAGGDGFGAARQKLGGRRFPPDRVLDSNFYTELHEGAIKPVSKEQRLAITEDQSVVSLTEARMNMHPEDWPAYKEQMLKSFEDTGADFRGTEADINDLAKARLESQFRQAEALYNELHPAGKSREQVLAEVQQQLLDALRTGASPREVRQLQAKLKLLEPDAYGTRAAKVGVVDQYQGAARAKSRQAAWDALASGRTPELSPRELAAEAAQEGGASAAKLRHAAPDSGATTAQAVSAAKYLARVVEAMKKAGLSTKSPLLDRTGEVIGSKQEVKAGDAAMGELRRWAQDTNRFELKTDQEIRDAYVAEVKRLGNEMDVRLRRNEAVKAGMDPSAAELVALARQRSGGGTPPPDGPRGGGGAKGPPKEPPKEPPGPEPPPKEPPKGTQPAKPAEPRDGIGRYGSAAEAQAAIVEALSKLKTSMDDPPGNYRAALEAVGKGKSPIHKKVAKLLPIVEAGLRSPELYGKVIAEAWERAVQNGTDINGALLQMAKEGGLEVRTVKEFKDSQDFFKENATAKKILVDKGVGDAHGINTHLLQDLVVDRALRAAGRNETAAEFRSLLGKLNDKPAGYNIGLGDLIWRVTYDVEGPGHINDPETMRAALKPVGFR